ncbi:MAG: hypothetical protein HFH88_14880 [Lachnospiraceae bacterium]|nr:hypothetical protein [Lachnospiraceae bacterium]
MGDLISREKVTQEIAEILTDTLISGFRKKSVSFDELKRRIQECLKEQPAASERDIVHPEYMGENRGVGCRVGRCRCGNLVRSCHEFCSDCGVKLEWGDVWPEGSKK